MLLFQPVGVSAENLEDEKNVEKNATSGATWYRCRNIENGAFPGNKRLQFNGNLKKENEKENATCSIV